MATLSETMTLAEFSARVTAGTLNIGQIYTISDKGWVLQAHSNTVTVPLKRLKITMGDSIPEGIVADEIAMETPVYTGDSENLLIFPDGYYTQHLFVNSNQNGQTYLNSAPFHSFGSEYKIAILHYSAISLLGLNPSIISVDYEDEEPVYKATFILVKSPY